jgi:hypothetical protein
VTDRAWVVVTGSRDFSDYRSLATVLNETWHDATQDGYSGLTLLHGAAAGADSLAELWGQRHKRHDVQCHRFPAPWSDPCRDTCTPGHRRTRRDGSTFCPTAGNYRNQLLVDCAAPHLPGVLLLACFSRPESRGTRDCLDRGIAAGMPYRLIGNPPTLKEPPLCLI